MKIYKKDTKGKIRYIDAYVEGYELIQVSGLVGTDSPIEHRKICKGKNIGKKNETTGMAQALSELNSLIAEKTKKEYFYTQEEAENNDVILPMLAKDYKEHSSKIDWEGDVFAQPKLDGMRALGDKELISREGGIIDTCKHITDIIKNIPLHLDGELYAHGKSFQANMRLIKKYREGETEQIVFHVYDIVMDKPFVERYKILKDYFLQNPCPVIEVVDTIRIFNEEALKNIHIKNLANGYEGSIIRHGQIGYKIGGRSENLLKYKDFIDLALPIKDIIAAEQRPTWGKPIFHWEGAENDELGAGMAYSHEEREEFLRNKEKYIGKMAELRFFEYSEEGVPRFPVMYGIRLDK